MATKSFTTHKISYEEIEKISSLKTQGVDIADWF